MAEQMVAVAEFHEFELDEARLSSVIDGDTSMHVDIGRLRRGCFESGHQRDPVCHAGDDDSRPHSAPRDDGGGFSGKTRRRGDQPSPDSVHLRADSSARTGLEAARRVTTARLPLLPPLLACMAARPSRSPPAAGPGSDSFWMTRKVPDASEDREFTSKSARTDGHGAPRLTEFHAMLHCGVQFGNHLRVVFGSPSFATGQGAPRLAEFQAGCACALVSSLSSHGTQELA